MTEILCPIETSDAADYSSLLSLIQTLTDQVTVLQSRIDSLLSVNGTETTEPVRLARSQYIKDGAHGMDANNSDIVGVNALVFRDECNEPEEGLMFPDSAGNYDLLKSVDGQLLYAAGHALGDTDQEYTVLNDDTGWYYFDMEPGFQIYSTGRWPRFRRKNGVVYIEGAVINTEEIAGGTTQHTMFVLPEEFRPGQMLAFRAQAAGALDWCMIISTNGSVTFSRYGAGGSYTTLPAKTQLCTCCSFIAEN